MIDAPALQLHIGAPAPAVYETWPLIQDALGEWTSNSPFVQIAAAATIQVECAQWRPQMERRANPRRQPDLAAQQDRYWLTGFFGRGFLQLTWRKNYEKYGKLLGIDLLRHPELALDPRQSARILAAYFREEGVANAADHQDWRLVRRFVNGPGMRDWDRFNTYVMALLEVIHG